MASALRALALSAFATFASTSASAPASANWTILPNTRCHNDVGQVHGIAAYVDCEAACQGGFGAPLFTYCPDASADGCGGPGEPTVQTCWCFPLAQLSSCESANGWTSGWTPPPPPVPPPADWAPIIARGDMAFSAASAEAIGVGYFPVVANGFLGIEMGPFLQPQINQWPWRDAGSMKLAGVYSGANWTGPSHRAQLPRLSDVTLLREDGANYTAIGCAVQYSSGLFYNRTLVQGGAQCEDTIVEQRAYAHRALRELFVFELRAFSASGSPAWPGCTLPVAWPVTPEWLNNVDVQLTLASSGSPPVAPAIWSGTTAVPEEEGLPLRNVAFAFDAWLLQGAGSGPTSLTFTPSAPLVSVRAVLRSDFDVPGATTPAQVAAAAAATWVNYTSTQTPAQLLASHEAAMAALWASGGVELTGNASLAVTVNASLYDIVSSLRADVNWSTSPGGIATGGYAGHSFWDLETWMAPVLTVLYPDLARAAAQYRFDRVAADEKNAQLSGYDGAMVAWESAVTGLWTAPWRAADTNENHISADVPLSHRKHFYATGDLEFLAASWPLLNGTCSFWACRFQHVDAVGPLGPPGYGPQCAPKDGVGNFTVLNVIPPDESSGVSNSSAYTNAAGAQTLAWCLEAAAILGIPANSLPPLWADIVAAPYLPLNASLYSGGPVHAEVAGYSGHTINQADVALLQYPLGLDFGPVQNALDLDYYSTVTDFAGMFTGDS